MDTIARWWHRYVGGGNINKTLGDIHAQYGKLEYLLPALYVLYCLILMQLIVKSFEVIGGFKRAWVVVIKLLLVHAGLALGVLLVVSRFSDSPAAKLLGHFFKEQLTFGYVGFIIPIACMLLAFVLAMLKKVFSRSS